MFVICVIPMRAEAAGDPRFFGTYCGSHEETHWVPGFLFIPVKITQTFSITAQIEYKESSRGHGVIAGRGRVEGEGRRIPVVFSGVVTRNGEAHGSGMAPGLEPIEGNVFLSDEGNVLTVQGAGRTFSLYKDRCGNEPPTATILSPGVEDSPFDLGDIIPFSAEVRDDQADELPFPPERLVWTSDRDGRLGNGTSISRDDLAPGPHRITFAATDGGGRTATDSVFVTIINDPPGTPTIRKPRPNETFCVGQEIPFQGAALDPEEGLLHGHALVWRSNVNGTLRDTGMRISQPLSEGTHIITLTATDSGGLASETSVRPIIVHSPSGENNAPIVSISRPEDPHVFPPLPFMSMGDSEEDCYTLYAEASDCEDGVDELSFEWRDISEFTGPGGERLSTQRSVELCALQAGAIDTPHEIKVTVTDSGGLTGTDSFTIYVIPGGLY
jgi:hypothetical protein